MKETQTRKQLLDIRDGKGVVIAGWFFSMCECEPDYTTIMHKTINGKGCVGRLDRRPRKRQK